MRKFFKAALRKSNFQHSLRIEPLETRNLLTATLTGVEQLTGGTLQMSDSNHGTATPSTISVGGALQSLDSIVGTATPATISISGTIHGGGGQLELPNPPSGTDKTVNVDPAALFIFSATDFGFSDPQGNDDFVGVVITTIPICGELLLAGAPYDPAGPTAVQAGQFISIEDIVAGRLIYGSSTSSPHPTMTFQVKDNGCSDPAHNLDPTPKTITFNTIPITGPDFYTVNEGETLDQRLMVSQLHMVSQPGDPVGKGLTYDFSDLTYDFSVTRDEHNGIRFTLGKPVPTQPGDIQMYELGPQLYFAAANGEVLTPGNYSDVVRPNSEVLDKPSMQVSPNFGLGLLLGSFTGQFTVNQVEYGTSGEVLSFDATYEQHVGSLGGLISPDPVYNPAALTGRIQYKIPNPQSVSLLQNDFDFDGDPLTAILATGPQHGTLTLRSDGGFVYTPEPGFTGTDTFEYKVNDGMANSYLVPVWINVIPFSHAPVGTSSTVSVPAGPSYALKTADFGFTDPQDTPADTFTRVKITTLPATASLTLSGEAVTEGQFISVADIAADNLVLTPATGIPHISFTFQVEDSGSTENGGEILDPTPKTLTFNVPPVAVDDAYSVDENQVLHQADLGNHWEITIGGSFYEPWAQKVYNYDGSNGQCTVIQDGNTLEFRYPWGGIFGNPAIRFAAAGGAQLVPGVYTNVKETADAFSPGLAMNWGGAPNPYITGEFTVHEAVYDDLGNILQFDATFQQVNPEYHYTHTGRFQYHASAKPSVSILQNDSDADGDPLSIVLVSQPSHGNLIFDHDGGFIYTPNQYYSGTDSFQYKLNDGLADSNVATVNIDVVQVHQAPEGTSGVVKMDAGVPYVMKPEDFGFTDPLDSVADGFSRVLFTSVPLSGILALNGVALTDGQFVSVDDIAAGKLTFACDPGLPHPSCNFQVQDDGSTDNGGVNLDPTPNTLLFDFAPVAQDDAYTVNENGVLDQSIYFTRLTMSSEPGDSLGQGRNYNILSCFATRNNANGIWILAESWSLTFSAPGNVLLVPGVYSGAERFPLQSGNPGLDISGEGRGSNTSTGQFTVLEAVYGPSGEILKFDAIFEQHSEGMSPALTGRIQYHASSLNAISVLANDSDIDGEALSLLLMTPPQHGALSVNSDGGFIYTPYPYFSGLDSFQYFAHDGFAASNLATVTITVNNVSQAPVGTSGTVNVPSDGTYALKAEDFGFSDPHDTPADGFAGVLITTLPTRGTMTLDKVPVIAGQFVSAAEIAEGKLTFMPPAYGTGSGRANFTFQVQDSGSTDNGGVVLDAEPKTLILNSTPVAFNDTYKIENALKVLYVLANDRDADEDFFYPQIFMNPSHGVLYFNEDSYVYIPDADFYGTDTFQYRITDGTADSNVATVTVDVVQPFAVTIQPAADQPSLTTCSPIHFVATFSEPVVDYSPFFLSYSGSTAGGVFEATITPLGTDGKIYDVAIRGMTSNGTVQVNIPAGAVHSAIGISNQEASSTDYLVFFLVNGVTISGTEGSDVFVFQAGDSSSTWTVTVNGQSKAIPANISNLVIDGKSGADTFEFHGGDGSLEGDLWYEYGMLQFGSHTVGYTNMENVTVTAASSDSYAILHDSTGNDVFEGLPGIAQLTTSGKKLIAKNFTATYSNASTGNDSAVMYGASADSRFIADSSGVEFSCMGFIEGVRGFKTVSAYAMPGWNNYVDFHDNDGHNLLIASYLGAQFYGTGFAYDFWNLTRINGSGGTGDEARFYGSPGGNTELNASPSQAVQTEANLTLVATGYSKFSSYVYPGGNTSANIVGSIGDDRAVTSPWGSQMFGSNFELSAWTYKNINLIGNEGHDVVQMYGLDGAAKLEGHGTSASLTSGNVTRSVDRFSEIYAHGNAASTATFFAQPGMKNSFDASPAQASMNSASNPALAEQTHGLGDMQDAKYGAAYKITALDFGSNTAYANAGGRDEANYADSAGADYFISSYLGSQMFGQGYSNSAWNFAAMTAASTGGADTARFYGSPSNPDSFVANPTNAKHSGTGYQSEAKNFARVEAYSGLGSGGTAQLTGTSGDDHFVSSPQGAQLWGQGYRIEAWNYASVKTEGAGGNDKADMYGSASENQLAADRFFAQLSGSGFSNRIDHFATANVHGSNGDGDGVGLRHAFLEEGIKDQPTDAQGLTITQKLWLYDFDWATISNANENQIGLSAPRPIDKLMTAFMYE